MIAKNKLDKSFGPIGAVSGVILFIVGLVLIWSSISGLALILLGGFVGFSSTSTLIDYDRKRVKFLNNLFGIISIGKWIDLTPDMKIGVKKTNKVWRTYSKANRSFDYADRDFRVILYDSAQNQIMPLKKVETLNLATKEVEDLSSKFGLAIIE